MAESACGLTHDGMVFSLEAADTDLAWLAQFMAPAFERVPAARAPADVRISFEPGGHVVRGNDGPAEGPVAFAFDSRAIHLPASPTGTGTRLIDVASDVSFDVTDDGHALRMAYGGDRLSARVALMRVVREYAHNYALSTGAVILHAAGVTLGDSAIAIAGRKGAGKTTLAMRLMNVPGVAYLANDRVLVRPQDRPRAVGVPTIVSVRPGTRACFPDVAVRLRECGDFRELARESRAHSAHGPLTSEGTWQVSPLQFCAALDRPAQASATLRAVVLLTPPGEGGGSLERLSEPAAAAALSTALLGGQHEQLTSSVFRLTSHEVPDSLALRTICSTLASRVVCFRGDLSDATPAVAAALIHTCLDARP